MITITGKKKNVTKAVTHVQQIQSVMANNATQEIKIPAKIHSTAMGAGGKLIQFIMSECGGVSLNTYVNSSFSNPRYNFSKKQLNDKSVVFKLLRNP